MDYLEYKGKVTKVEERVIYEHFKTYLSHNDMGQEGWSSPEMEHNYLVFKTGWVSAMAFTS